MKSEIETDVLINQSQPDPRPGTTMDGQLGSPAPQDNHALPRLAYSVAEAAEILGVSQKTIRRLIDRRLLRASRALRHLLIPKREIERFLEETTFS